MTQKNWEKEFDEKFGHNSICSRTGLIEIQSFIRQNFIMKESLLEKIRRVLRR